MGGDNEWKKMYFRLSRNLYKHGLIRKCKRKMSTQAFWVEVHKTYSVTTKMIKEAYIEEDMVKTEGRQTASANIENTPYNCRKCRFDDQTEGKVHRIWG